jgi:hypothetical protein
MTDLMSAMDSMDAREFSYFSMKLKISTHGDLLEATAINLSLTSMM